jgi:hypothetical protein
VIDDEEGVRAVARRIFERAGFRGDPRRDGVEGLECFRSATTRSPRCCST